jgi:hypothetical protein
MPKDPRRRRTGWLIAIVVSAGLALTGQAAGPADTPEARREAADELLATIPVTEDMITSLIREMSEDLPENRRETFVEQMRERVDMNYVKRVLIDGLVAGLSTTELKAATKFYSSPEGKAFRAKLPTATDKVMPLIQAELMRSAQRLTR